MKVPSCIAALPLLFALAPPLPAQTILLVSQELVNGSPLSPPLAVRDGLSATLYEEGFIVFDDNCSSTASDAPPLMSLARSTGAEMILQVSTELTETTAGATVLTIRARTSFTLTRVDTGAVVAQGSMDATNKDREGTVDRSGLGMEIGRSITGRIRKALGGSIS